MERWSYLPVHDASLAREKAMTSRILRAQGITLLGLGLLLLPAARQLDASSNSSKPAPSQQHAKSKARSGERVFMTNCARCHMPPTSIPPRITGTVIMHMRTRARLSRDDEQLLLKYMAP